MTNIAELSQTIFRVRVAVPVHLYDCFDYKVSAEEYEKIDLGSRVAVSFGRQNLVGIVTEKLSADTPVDPRFQLKNITELLDEKPIINPTVLKLASWSAQYYQFPSGEVMHAT